jgi:hypothetical protein
VADRRLGNPVRSGRYRSRLRTLAKASTSSNWLEGSLSKPLVREANPCRWLSSDALWLSSAVIESSHKAQSVSSLPSTTSGNGPGAARRGSVDGLPDFDLDGLGLRRGLGVGVGAGAVQRLKNSNMCQRPAAGGAVARVQ